MRSKASAPRLSSGSTATIGTWSGCRRCCWSTCSRSIFPGSTALARGLLVLAAAAALVAGCGSDDHSMVVRERFEAIQEPHRISGTTARAGQVARNDCKLSAVYKVREATGTAFLIQSQDLHLRLRVPRAGTTYELECLGPLLVELPADATKIEATAHDLSGGGQRSLSVRTHVPSVRLAGGGLRPTGGRQLVLVEWPRVAGPGYDNYRVELAFRLPKAPLVRERAVYTASVSCGGSSYLQPVVPLIEDLGFVNAFTVPPDKKPFDFILPHIAAGISSHGEATQTLECP